MSSPYGSSPYGSSPTPGGPNRGRGGNPPAHGGDFDPFAISFDTIDGIPTQVNYGAQPGPSNYAAQPGTSMPSTPSSSSGQSPGSQGVVRVPVGARVTSNPNNTSYNQSKQQTTYSVGEISSASPTGRASDTSPSNKNSDTNEKSDMQDIEFRQNQNRENYPSRTKLNGYLGNFFTKSSKYRIVQSPHSLQDPGYSDSSDTKFWHRDGLQRIYEGQADDRYLDPLDGRVRELIVQCIDAIYRGPKNSTYKRTFIRNVAPPILRIANWPSSHLDDEPKTKSAKHWARLLFLVKWPITCYVLNHLIGIPGLASTGAVVNGGCYDPFPVRYWGFCKVTRNLVEQGTSSAGASPVSESSKDASDKDKYRVLEPRWLCFISDKKYGKPRLVEEWKNDPANQSHHKKCPEYLFIAYTVEQWPHSSPNDLLELHAIATRATRAAGLLAYWIGASCLKRETLEDDVYRISDVVRGANSLVIILGPRPGELDSQTTTNAKLRHWGERVWTLPEALLSTSQQPIKVYCRGYSEPLVVPKKQFAALAWNDSKSTRQLIDHYEGNLTLSRLELVTIAMQSLFARKTVEHLKGDLSYALMGLLRSRPEIDRTDSGFQAFARLSLANDSDRLLERMMCILPKGLDQDWSSTLDSYGANIWDIYPTCQIAGICENDSVLLDGAFGATIRWDKFRKVANTRRIRSVKRLAGQIVLHGAPYFLVIGLLCFRVAWDFSILIDDIWATIHVDVPVVPTFDIVLPGSAKAKIFKHWLLFFGAIGFILIAVACLVFISSPYITRVLYEGKFWGTQAWLFGFEGHADIETIESQIFGAKLRRLRWSTYGSSLSRHERNDFNEVVGVDPTTDPSIRTKVQEALINTNANAMRIFTLVDTNTMSVTLFEAVRPPVAVLLCASEGGMQRAIACSYDWTTGICYRETVLRLETIVLEKMSRVPRFRLGVKRV